MTTKPDHERDVFREFIEAAGLGVDADSIRLESPPRPDIYCTLDGTACYFELTRATDQGIANDVGGLLAEGGVGSAHAYDDKVILRATLEKKAGKAHETDGCPLHLLVYYDGVFHSVGSLKALESSFQQLKDPFAHRWARIWLFDLPSGEVLS